MTTTARARQLGRSLTLRLALLYALSTLLILIGVSYYLLHVIDRHFVEQDLMELQGKLELSSRLINKANSTGSRAGLARQLDDALTGHHHLAVAVYEQGQRTYQFGHAHFPAALAIDTALHLNATTLRTWMQDAHPYRGAAIRITPRAAPPYEIALAVDISHHEDFLDSFQLALALVLVLAALLALMAGWMVARIGLAPLHRTAQLAREISAEHLDQRLPTEGIPPELEELTDSFNAMLDRLSDAIERLSSFAVDLAHEMRTPVSNLMMQTQVMLGQSRSVEEYRDVLASNIEEYERLARTIGDMLFLAKADNGLIVPHRESVDLASEVSELFGFYEALAEDRQMTLHATGNAVIEGDRLMLRRALSNLIANAIRYAPPDSIVSVTLEQLSDSIRISIENPAPDLDTDKVKRLFDRFYRSEHSGGEGTPVDGSGLGLAITRSIARAHCGSIHAESADGCIRFVLVLPVSSGHTGVHSTP